MHGHVCFFSHAGSGVALPGQIDLVLCSNFCRHIPVLDHDGFVCDHTIHAVLIVHVEFEQGCPLALLCENWGSLELLSWRFDWMLELQNFRCFLIRHRFWGSVEAPQRISCGSCIDRCHWLTLHFFIDALRDGL